MFKRLKVKACDDGMDLGTIFEIEKLILNRLSWRINMVTSIEIKIRLTSLDESITAEFDENVENLIWFSIEDHEIYRSYDSFTVTLASIFIACNCMQKETEIYDQLVENLQCSRALVEDCVSLILKRYYDDGEQVNQTDNYLNGMMDTSETINSTQNSCDDVSISCVSPFSVSNTFDHIQINEMMLCEKEQNRNDTLSTYSKIGCKGRKKFYSKNKNKYNKKILKKKMKKKMKTKKERFFVQKRFRLSKEVKN